MQEWILPVLNIAVLVIIFLVSARNRAAKFGPFDYFSSGKDPIYLFWSASCGFCRQLKEGAWKQVIQRARMAGVPIVEIELKPGMSTEEMALVSRVGLDQPGAGVPLIAHIPAAGPIRKFEGDRTDEAIMSWYYRV